MEMTKDKLDIRGMQGRSVPNVFWRQKAGSHRLAIIWPGYGYRIDMPVLYYATRVALLYGYDTLCVGTNYSEDLLYLEMPDKERSELANTEAEAAYAAATSGNSYSELLLMGKSLGTFTMLHVLESQAQAKETKCVWLTPVLTSDYLYEHVLRLSPPSLFVIGDKDPYFSRERLDHLVRSARGHAFVVPGATHDLEVEGDVFASIEALSHMMQALSSFLGAS